MPLAPLYGGAVVDVTMGQLSVGPSVGFNEIKLQFWPAQSAHAFGLVLQ